MRYVSLFSGIEAATVAWSRLGWEPLAFAEVDEFPCAVLAHRFPGVPNLGDVCEIDWKEFHARCGAVDVLVGGSPCQSFSIAGNREGLQGESRLMFEYIRAVRELVQASGGAGPRYILWENVPGCLSSNKGRDFGCLLDELEDCGYCLAWRTLDSQFARVFHRESGRLGRPVPQRRRRVYLVGSLGTDGAGEILFERTCLRGDHPKGREAREALAEPVEGGAGGGHCAGFRYNQRPSSGGIGYGPVSPTVDADSHPNGVVSVTTANTNANGSNFNDSGACYTLDGTNSNAVGYVVPENAINRPEGGTNGPMAYGFDEGSPTLRASKDVPAVAFEQNQRGEVRLNAGDGSVAGALSSNPAQTKGQGASLVMTQYGDIAGTLRARGDSSPCADSGQNVVCMGSGQARATLAQDGTSTTLDASHEQPIVCMADDNGKCAVDEGLCGSLKVGGGSPMIACSPTAAR